jgi:hypothetical protein
MNWKLPVAMLGLLLLVPFGSAAPNAQTGQLTQSYYTACPQPAFPPAPDCGAVARVAVQPGSTYVLTGSGDFDVFFYGADNLVVGEGAACGSDTGTVPATAAFAVVGLYSNVPVGFPPGPLPCSFAEPIVASVPSVFAYVDGA